MLSFRRNTLILPVFIILFLLVLLVSWTLRVVNENNALRSSVENLEQHQENLQQKYDPQIEALESEIREWEEATERLSLKLDALEDEKLTLKYQDDENNARIDRIWAVDSLLHEIARHYR